MNINRTMTASESEPTNDEAQIHDKTGKRNWSSDVDDWEREFNLGDVVISDGYSSFKTMFVVSVIDFDAPNDNVVRRGVFWNKSEAERYADLLADK